jgi:hypothetical protein
MEDPEKSETIESRYDLDNYDDGEYPDRFCIG